MTINIHDSLVIKFFRVDFNFARAKKGGAKMCKCMRNDFADWLWCLKTSKWKYFKILFVIYGCLNCICICIGYAIKCMNWWTKMTHLCNGTRHCNIYQEYPHQEWRFSVINIKGLSFGFVGGWINVCNKIRKKKK